MKRHWFEAIISVSLFVMMTGGCGKVDDDRLPAMPVYIDLGNAGLWNIYGVHSFGDSRRFVPGLGEPRGYAYNVSTGTGFGGVLLIGGMNPYTTETGVPLAYDLACPVERDPQVRVQISGERFDAVCPKCGSHYDVTMRGGAPLSGPASEGQYKYGLTVYNCLQTREGGYIITR